MGAFMSADPSPRFSRVILLSLVVSAGCGWAAVGQFFAQPSEAQNAVLLGRSLARLLPGGLFTLLMLALSAAALLLAGNTTLARRAAARLDARAAEPGRWLVWLGSALVLWLVCAAGLGLSLIAPGATSQAWLARGAALAANLRVFWAWGLLSASLAFAALWSVYAPLFHRNGGMRIHGKAAVNLVFTRPAALWWSALLLLGCLVFLLPYAPRQPDYVPTHDSGIFLYFGQQILAGKLPYRDLWDHKPPLVFYLDALGLALGRGSIWGVWALEWASLSAAVLLAFNALRRGYGSLASGAALLALLPNLVFVIEGGNLTEEFALPFQMLALFLLLHGLRADRRTLSPLHSALIGAAFGMAFLLKQNLIGVWVSISLILLGRSIATRRWRGLLPFAWIGLGAALVVGISALYFAARGCLYDYWDVAFRFNFIYSDMDEGTRLGALADMARFLTQTSGFFLAALLAWVVGVIHLLRRRADPAGALLPLLAAVIDLPIELALINTSTRNYRHYFMSLLPACVYLVAFLLWKISALLRQPRFTAPNRAKSAALSLFTVIALFGMVFTTRQPLHEHFYPAADVTVNQAVRYIQAHTTPEDRVALWGSQTVINFLSHRQAPTRFVHETPLFQAGYSDSALVAQFLGDVQKDPPRLIVDTRQAPGPFVQALPGGACAAPALPYPAHIQPIYDYVCAHYTWTDEIGKDHWIVWVKNNK
jgi:hypothetical protein